MSKINILSLGGLDEKHKNLYLLEVDSKIYIIDCGIYEPLVNDFGIEYFAPKLDYLKENRDKVKAIFLSSSNMEQIGSLPQLIRIIPNLKIYASPETIDVLPFLFGDMVKDWNTEKVVPNKPQDLNGINVKPIFISSSIPGTLGYIFKTEYGNVVYFTDYIFDSIEEYSHINLVKSLSSLSHEKNLLFMSDSLNSAIQHSIAPSYRVTPFVKNSFKEENRIIATVYDDDVINVVELLCLAKKYNYKVAFTDQKFINIIKTFQDHKRIIDYPIQHVKDTYEIEKNLLIIISGSRSSLYQKINIYVEDGFTVENFINENDVVAILSPPQPGNEDKHQEISNKISRIDPTLIVASAKEKFNIHPSQFDLKNYLMFINPEYFMPIKGFFKEMKSSAIQAKIINEFKNNPSSEKEEKIILADVGEICSFENGKYIGKTRKLQKHEVGYVVIESVNNSNLESNLLTERESLGKDGLLTISFLVDKKTKEIISNFDIQMKGVIFIKSQEHLLTKMQDEIKLIIEQNTSKDVDWKLNRVVALVNKAVSKILRSEIKKVPEIITNIKEI